MKKLTAYKPLTIFVKKASSLMFGRVLNSLLIPLQIYVDNRATYSKTLTELTYLSEGFQNRVKYLRWRFLQKWLTAYPLPAQCRHMLTLLF